MMEAYTLGLQDWGRKVTAEGVVFYVRRGTGDTRWVHPGLSQCVASLTKYDNIRYAAYRLSSKLIEVEMLLGTAGVSLGLVQSVLAHHGLVSPSLVLDWATLRHVMADLWHQAGVPPHLHEAVASLVEQVLDPGHLGDRVTVLGLKTVLAVMTKARLRDRLAFLFREHSDYQARLSEPGLTYLLTLLSRIPEILGEGVMFGSGVVPRGVFSCLQAGGGRVVTEEVWMSWASREPPELVWLTTSYRQFASRQVVHQVRCSACHTLPIMGMRYQCLKCLNYDLCQNCFFVGLSTKGHKPKHPVQEYCYPSTRKEAARAFLATLANKLKPVRSVQTRPRRKITRALTADKISSGASSAASSRPSSLQSSKSAHSKLSQLLVKVSPRSSSSLETKTPLSPRSSLGDPSSKTPVSPRCSIGDKIDKLSPVSSGFCSGEEGELSPVLADLSPISQCQNSPIYEEPAPETVDSPGLEWDEGGIELGHRTLAPSPGPAQLSDTSDADILRQIEQFENSIFRQDLDTGEMRCYQHNTRRVARRDQMTSILGHLEEDHKQLQARLEDGGDDLSRPVQDAQNQLGRLKDLMTSMFRSQNFLNDGPGPHDEDADGDGGEHSHLHPKPEEIDLEYTYAGLHKTNTESTRLDASPRECALAPPPSESTRLMVGLTPRPGHRLGHLNLDIFSPITSVVRSQLEQEERETADTQGVKDIQPATDSDETPTPTITFNCLSPDENKTDDNDNEDDEASLTQYQLSDLSRRLGGTQLYISRDTGLDLTQQLEAGTGDQDTSKYAETMEELEQLMARLEDVFQSFREPSLKGVDITTIGVKDDNAAKDDLYGLVNGVNEDLYGYLSKSKESRI